MCSDKEKKDAFARTLKARVAKHAFEGLQEISNRTAILLEKHEILVPEPQGAVDPVAISLLTGADSSRRVSLPPGPLLMYTAPDRETHRLVIQVEHLLLNHDSDVRSAAVQYFLSLGKGKPPALWPQTEKLLSELSSAVKATEQRVWRDASVRLFDALARDTLCSLAAVKQSVNTRFDQGLRDYLPRLLTPSVESLGTLCTSCSSPSASHEAMTRGLQDAVAGASSLAAACDEYYAEVGHVPVVAPLDMAALLNEWLRKEGESPDLWQELWSWADSTPSPVPRYHLCCAFAQHSALIPADQKATFWQEVEQILQLPKDAETDTPVTLAWRVRCDLARYYLQYFECQLPGQDGENLAVLAWWLSDQVATVFGPDPALLKYLESQAQVTSEFHSYLWKLVSSPIRPSLLRHGTLYVSSIWQLSLLSVICQNLDALDPSSIPDRQKQALEGSLLGSLVAGFPLRRPDGNTMVYGFEAPAMPAAEQWLSRADEDPNNLRTFVGINQKFADKDSFLELLKGIPKEQEGVQIGIAQAFRLMAGMNEAPVDDIWHLVNEVEWRDEMVAKVSLRTLEILYDAFGALQVHAGDRWRRDMAHIWALSCESCPDEAERRRLLFTFVVASCISADSVGAVHRLLKGSHRHEFREYVEQARAQFRDIQMGAPPWVRARFRAILAALHIR